MNICKNCRFWGAYIDGVCDFVTTIYTDNPETGFYIEAGAADDTEPNFECVYFLSKENKKELIP